VENSSSATGVAWAGQAFSQPVLNSAFQIWQRGTSFSLAASTGFSTGFLADRWQTSTGANEASTITRQSTNDTTNLPNIQYCLRYQRNSGQTGTGNLLLAQSFETANSIPYAGKTVTLSFYARAGANYSATSNTLGVVLSTGTGTDQNITNGYTGAAYPINLATATLTTTWQRFTYTASIGATATELGIYFQFTPTGTASTNDYYEVTGVQIDLGSVALPFRTYAGTLQGELAACQRYYYRNTATSSYGYFGYGSASSTLNAIITIPLPVTLRAAPSAVDFSTLRINDTATAFAVTSFAIDQTSQNCIGVTAVTAGSLTQYRPYSLSANNSTSAYVGFSAEL
jgi:hypothetical protein